jgi:hypothetical protein
MGALPETEQHGKRPEQEYSHTAAPGRKIKNVVQEMFSREKMRTATLACIESWNG